ncbi:MAG TPA: hypothetical protein VKU01_19145 [Bryobacteraceae bacterium]|nr:hypothetical protein [Bryobacteraceae bacterium]
MPNRFAYLGCSLLLALVIPVSGQTQQEKKTPVPKAATAGKYNPPRTSDGHPDLSGTYDAATLTPLERMPGTPAVMTKEEAAKQEAIAASLKREGDKSLEGNRAAPPKGGDGSPGPAGNVGGYNSGWLDPGSTFNVVDGQIRASIVVDPPEGKVPPLVSGAAQRGASSYILPGGVGLLKVLLTPRPTSDATESNDPGLEKVPGIYDDPERRPLAERCLLGFGSTSGPPMLPDYFYNNLHQIVQTPDRVLILTEMVHDVRVVRMNGQHLPSNIRLWFGDSVGHWEGDTLVVDTTNFSDKTSFRGSTPDLHVIERFTRLDAHTLLYRFTIDDPKTWTKPWTGEYSWPEAHGPIYEYACHEGNYALGDILKGARLREQEEAAKTGGK